MAAGLLILWLAVVVLWLSTNTDRAGKLLYGIAAVLLVALAATDVLWTPRLAVTPSGLVVRSPTRSGRFGWDEIATVRVDRRSRLGLRQATLEVDLDEDLLVFSRRSLDADPQDVLEVIEAARARSETG